MKRSLFGRPLFATVLLLSPLGLTAADKPAQKEPATQPAMRSPKPKSARPQAVSNVISEILGTGFSLGAKQSKSFDAISDFTGAERVSIGVEAPASMNIGDSNFSIVVWWSMPGLDWFTCQDVLTGDGFYFANQGGGVVSVYGPELRIELRNNNDTAITINQLAVYGVAR